MDDLLLDVIQASENRVTITHRKRRNVFKLISWGYLSQLDIEPIREFQISLLKEYGVYPAVIGGGYGCSMIEFEVHAPSAKEASRTIRSIIKDKDFQMMALKLKFKVLITNNPYERVDLASGLIDGYSTRTQRKKSIKEGPININITQIKGGLRDSSLSIDSPHSQHHIERAPKVDAKLTEILECLRKDSEVTSEKLMELFDNIMFIKTEMLKKKPNKNRILETVSHVGSVASVAALSIQLHEIINAIL